MSIQKYRSAFLNYKAEPNAWEKKEAARNAEVREVCAGLFRSLVCYLAKGHDERGLPDLVLRMLLGLAPEVVTESAVIKQCGELGLEYYGTEKVLATFGLLVICEYRRTGYWPTESGVLPPAVSAKASTWKADLLRMKAAPAVIRAAKENSGSWRQYSSPRKELP